MIVEALDRLSRDQHHLAHIWKRLSFLGIEIRAVRDGTADAIQVGIRGLLGNLFLTDLVSGSQGQNFHRPRAPHKLLSGHWGKAGVVKPGIKKTQTALPAKSAHRRVGGYGGSGGPLPPVTPAQMGPVFAFDAPVHPTDTSHRRFGSCTKAAGSNPAPATTEHHTPSSGVWFLRFKPDAIPNWSDFAAPFLFFCAAKASSVPSSP
ncbi:MAG: recombinase family protein [Phyllobacteriaceae bacterium]|nr:recombinase family protein [Phyllobacteriaceae bacterium]